MITAEDILEMKGHNIVSVDRSTTVIKAIEKMVENKIGAVTITDNGEITGIWTERDLLRNSLSEDFDLNTSLVGDCMFDKLHRMPHSSSVLELEGAFLGLQARYIFITKEDKVIGLLSASDWMKTHLNKKREEVENLKSYVSMEYYENWKWDAKKR